MKRVAVVAVLALLGLAAVPAVAECRPLVAVKVQKVHVQKVAAVKVQKVVTVNQVVAAEVAGDQVTVTVEKRPAAVVVTETKFLTR